MITDLLGAPSIEDVAHVTSHRAVKSLLSQAKPRALGKLYALSPTISHGAVHLLSQMLVFNPVRLLYTPVHELICIVVEVMSVEWKQQLFSCE